MLLSWPQADAGSGVGLGSAAQAGVAYSGERAWVTGWRAGGLVVGELGHWATRSLRHSAAGPLGHWATGHRRGPVVIPRAGVAAAGSGRLGLGMSAGSMNVGPRLGFQS